MERVSGITCLATACGSTDGTLNPLGGFGGVYYDFKTFGPVRLGVDARGGATITSKNAAQFQTGPKPRVYSALGGLRASFHTRYDFLHPYVEGAVGYGKSNVQTSTSATPLEYPSGVEYRGLRRRRCAPPLRHGLPCGRVWHRLLAVAGQELSS